MKRYFVEHGDQFHRHQSHIYTDGSKLDGGVGSAAVSASCTKSVKLLRESSIFTAELCDILCGLQIVRDSPQSAFTIFCDSRSALNVVDHYDSTHPLIAKITIWLIKLTARNKRVKFCWCPAHVGITGNEEADAKAKSIAERDIPAANNALPYRDWYPMIKTKMKLTWGEEWRNVAHNKLRTTVCLFYSVRFLLLIKQVIL